MSNEQLRAQLELARTETDRLVERSHARGRLHGVLASFGFVFLASLVDLVVSTIVNERLDPALLVVVFGCFAIVLVVGLYERCNAAWYQPGRLSQEGIVAVEDV